MWGRIDKHTENFNKKIDNIRKHTPPKKKGSEMNNAVTEFKNIQKFQQHTVESKERISQLKDKTVEVTQPEKGAKRK